MGTLLLVRHGQASFFEANYDRLSSAGETQARLLGAAWARRGVKLDRVFAGPLLRQQRSAEIAGEAFAAAGGSWPKAVLVPELEEMRIEPLFREHAPELFEKHAHLRGLGDALLAADGDEARARVFARLFEATVALWIQGQLTAPGVEAWSDFRGRVRHGLGVITEAQQASALDLAPSGRVVAAFTSAGVVGAAVQVALDLTDERALQLAWRVRNSSVSTFLYKDSRFSLAALNELPHLEDPALITLR